MSRIRQCDRCMHLLLEGEGSRLTIADTAEQGVEEFENIVPPAALHLDLCGICRSEFGDFLRINQLDDPAEIDPLAIEEGDMHGNDH
ncbi:MAG: hypothetical protein NVS3B1_06340 [Marmoricola sp.]